MSALGLRGTELGPVGYLPRDPAALIALLGRYRLRPVAAFVPVVFDPGLRRRARVDAVDAAAALAAAGGEILLVAPIADSSWSGRAVLSEREEISLRTGLEDLGAAVASRGLRMAVHPHVGSLVESADQVERLLEADLEWCLDTGHLLIGGVDPLEFARDHGDRVIHVHLKDVDAALAAAVSGQGLSLAEATRRSLFRPLGDGDIPVADILAELDRHGYSGWLTLEQDTILDSPDSMTARRDVERSVAFIRALDGACG